MQQHQPGTPAFLDNSPNVICEQVLWLVKNSDLNFQVKETPFGLNLSIKKRFVKHCNNSGSSQQIFSSTCPSQTQPYFQAAYPNFRAPQNEQSQEASNTDHESNMENFVQLKKSMDAIKEEKKDLEHDYTTVERAYNRLLEEHKELQLKHEKICSKVKTIQDEKDLILKDHNAIAVAFENSKQCLKDRTKSSEKELTKVKLELGKPLEFKAEKVAEEKKSKKAAKKNRQREQKVVVQMA